MSETKPTDDADVKDEPLPKKEGRERAIDESLAEVDSIEPRVDREDDDASADGDDAAGDDAETKEANEASEAKAKEAEPEDEKEPDILPRGNPLRRRGIGLILAGGIPAFLLMAKNGQNWWGVPVGLIFVAIAAFGVMDLLGTFDDAEEHVAERNALGGLAPAIGLAVVMLLVFCGFLALAQAAVGPWWLGSLTVTTSFLGLVAAVFKLGQQLGPWKLDEAGDDRPLLKRHGFWVLAIGAFLYFPAMGLQSLWDPWETHYGEVAREILSRDDWISLWWAQDGWFWSKPILNFWIQSLAMATLGTHYQADMMMTGAGGAWSAQP